MGLAIVAIPEEQDRVWKISSEKVPHLTLLFLGDEESADTQQIVQFVQHAVEMSQHGQFYLDVDRRGELGEANADVLFFSKRSWNLKWIKQFRGQLLQNGAVRMAYDSAEQFTAPQDWVPHLTLGYPETPAKKPDPDNDYPLYSVAFDRIAVWTGDFDGPEFRLEWPEREYEGDMAIAYHDAMKAALLHYGVKGMKWGHRKSSDGSSGSGRQTLRSRNKAAGKAKKEKYAGKSIREANRLDRRERRSGRTERNKAGFKKIGQKVKSGAKATDAFLTKLGDAHFEGKANDARTFMRVHDQAARNFNNVDIPKINNKPEYRGANFARLGPQSKLTQRYEKEMMDTFDARLREAAQAQGTNWSGTRRLELDGSYRSDGGWGLKVVDTDKAKHASGDDEFIFVRLKRDENGHIIDIEEIELAENAIAQDGLDDPVKHTVADVGEAFIIEHYGVKGMRWGFRRERPQAVATTATTHVPHGNRRKTKVKVEGGQNHDAHEDAIKVAEAKAKLKKSGTAALSNKELQEVANRVQLEERVKLLTSSKGSKFVKNELENEGKNLAKSAAKAGAKKGAKKAATALLV